MEVFPKALPKSKRTHERNRPQNRFVAQKIKANSMSITLKDWWYINARRKLDYGLWWLIGRPLAWLLWKINKD